MSVFHEGEIQVQKKLDVPEKIASFAARVIRPLMLDQHRTFFEEQQMIMLSILDASGHPLALPLYGEPGFVSSPDEKTLIISVKKSAFSIFNLTLEAGQKVGLLGLDFATRRRNRLNGQIAEITDNSITVSVDQSFGNCPQYIQRRDLTFDVTQDAVSADHINRSPNIDNLSELMLKSDTFFIASRSGNIQGGPEYGADVSHRGGKPGFAKITPEGTFIWPDFSGNQFYNTLGNIQTDPRVGLFIPDFESGAGFYLTGRAKVLWEPMDVADFLGAERFIEITIERIIELTSGGPVSSNAAEPWVLNKNTGEW